MLFSQNHRRYLVIRVAALLAFLIVTSCGTIKKYPGPTLPDEQVGFLQIEYIWNNVQVSAVDNDPTWRWSGNGIPRWVALLPGYHTVELYLQGDTPGGGWMQSGSCNQRILGKTRSQIPYCTQYNSGFKLSIKSTPWRREKISVYMGSLYKRDTT